MILRNEEFQEVELSNMLDDFITDLDSIPNMQISESDAEEALAEMVFRGSLISNKAMLGNENYTMPDAEENYREPRVVKAIWQKLLKNICGKFDEDTEREKIIEIIIKAVAENVPFGILVKPLLKIILKYILKSGHNITCRNVAIL